MNKKNFRVIFNKNRGLLMAVAENVSSQGKGTGAGSESGASHSPLMRFAQLAVAVAALFGSVAMVQAQIVASPTAAPNMRPTVTQTASGIPLIQIAQPNSAGLSHNFYDTLNVGTQGAVLNNSRVVTGTQLAGQVQGNPNLSGGSANIILNEVVGGSRSQLNGYLEVAGQKAQVIISNENGITCSGCGWINTSRGVLTTGTPVFGGDGSLQAFRVTRGDIQINGLNAANTDQTDLIARSVQVNGQLWANQLNVVTGTNQVNYADLGVTVIAGDNNKPTVSIDVAALGGMYANKIRLVGTENGVGVRSLGEIASSAGDLNLDSQGKITLAGHTSATGQVRIVGSDGITNSGTLYGQQAVQLYSAGQIANSGTVAAQSDLTLFSGSINSTGVLGAGIDANGHATQVGSISMTAAGAISATGQNTAGDNIAMNGTSLNLAHAQTSATGNIGLAARAGDIDHTGGNLQAGGGLSINASGAIINDQAVIDAGQLTSTSASLSNHGGTLNQSGSGTTSITISGALDNGSGVITTAAQNVNLQAGGLSNDAGQLSHTGTGTLTVNTGALSNVGGNVATGGQLAVTASSLNNQRGQVTAAGAENIAVTGNVSNNQGVLQAGSALNLQGVAIDNSAGRITSLDASGLTLSTTGQLANAAGTTAGGAAGGVIGGNGDVTVTAASATNSGQIIAGNNLNTTVSGTLDNRSGRLAAGHALQANAGALKNNAGVIDAAVVALTIPQLDNTHGKITADQLTIHSANLTNQAGQIAQFGTGTNVIAVANALDNSAGGVIQTNSADLTLTPQTLNNAGGTIALAGTGTLTVTAGSDTLQNQQGSIGGNGATNVSAASITNQGGSMFGQKATTIAATQGDLDNSAGGYLGGSHLAVNAAGNVNNTAGKIEGTQTGLTLTASSLNNVAGTVQSLGSAPLSITATQGISNGIANGVGGFIGGSGAVNVNAGPVDNTGGTFYAKDTLALQANGQLTNSYGVIQSGSNLSATASGAVLNNNGRIEANGSTATMTVSGTSLDNTAGRIANSGTGLTQINGGSQITNTNAANTANLGTIGGNGDVNLTSSNLDNSSNGQVIAAGSLTLNTGGTVNNNFGKLHAGQNLQLNQSGAAVTNVGGQISAAGNINVNLASLNNIFGLIATTVGTGGDIALSTSGDLNNNAGTIASDRNLTLTAPTLIGNGKVIAGQDAAISLQGDYANTAGNTLTANRDLTISTTGNLTNTGNLEAVRNLTLNAANVDNQSAGLINAGNGATVIHAANAITNTGRIYGNDIALGAQMLTNDVDTTTNQAGVIASRNTLQIGAQQITNREHALIQSLGDMTLGGALDANNNVTGSAASILNSSATIDSGGALTLQTASLMNQNNHFTTTQQDDPTQTTHVTQYASWATPNTWYTPDQVTWGDSGDGGVVLILPDGSRFEKFSKKDYTQTVSNTVVTSSDPGKISSAGNMTLSGNVTNDKSTIIAGGTLGGTTGPINNIGATGTTDTVDHMTARENYYHYVDGHPHQNHYDFVNNGAAYDVNMSSIPLALQVWTVQQNTQPVTGPNQAIGNGVGGNAVPTVGGLSLSANQSGQTVGSGSLNTVGAATGSAGKNTGTTGSHQTLGTPTAPLPNLVLPNNQLFTIHTQPGQSYLIQTDPKFANYGNFISSNYMLGLLGINPAATEKRLGDGFYEEKLVSDQVAQLTGKRFLGGYASNEEEYKALMEAGVASAKQFQLTPGIALTDAQMASLTSDIVWLVSQDVTLPDGSHTQVLAPVVYLTRVDAGDISPTGALISGRDIDLTINGTLKNGGTLQAATNMIIQATDIANTGDIRSTGKNGTTILMAQNDILNNGGSISGHRVGVLAGRDVTMSTEAFSATSVQGTNTALGRVASVTADQLSVQAGRDINLTAVNVSTTGDATLSAGRDLNLKTVNTQSSYNVNYATDNHLYENQTQVNGTAINAGGNLTLIAKQDINAAAATANAGGQLAAIAGRDVNIGTAQQTSSLDQAIYTTSHGMMSSSSSRSQRNDNATDAIGSSFTGNSIAIQSGRDTTVQGSQVIAKGDLNINAGRDLNIVSAQQTSKDSFSAEEKKSGFSGGFLTGVSYGNNAQDQHQNGTSVNQIGSDISGANVHTSSGRDTTITASAVTADQNIGINAGRDINVLAAANTQTTQSDSHSSGTSIGVMGGLNFRFTNYGQTSAEQNGSGSGVVQSTSLISANGGNLSMQAGLDKQYKGTGQGNVTTQGAELIAKDKLSIGGNAVDLQAIQDRSNSQFHAETHSVTLGSSLTGAIGGALTRIGDMATESQHTSNDRLKGALALKAGYDAYKLAGALPGAIDAAKGSIAATQNALAGPNGDAPPSTGGAGFGISVNLGTSQSKQDSKNSATQARGTTAQAGSIDITAREGDINMEGAKLQAQDISLDAAKNINLAAAKSTADLQSSNSGSSAGIGATLGSNGQQTGLSFQIGASTSKGHANGTETTYDNTQISATNQLSIKSGGDLNMKGAQLAGNKVIADVGGDLNIWTLQNVSNFDSKQESGGFSLSICVPPICVGSVVSGSVSYAKQTVDHNYQSAVGQSGIVAGSDGFDIKVKGNTDLKGAAITSTATPDKNSLQTASLTYSDLTNTQHTKSESVSVSASTSSVASNVMGNVLGNLNGSIGMPKSGDQTGSTNSVISPAKITITGSGDAAKDAQSQANVSTLTGRDAATANTSLANTLTLQQAQELQAQQQKAQENQRAAGLVGAALSGMVGDIAQKANWADGSPEKIVLHGIVGLIEAKIGGGSAAAGAVAGMTHEALVPIMSDYLVSQGYKPGSQAFNDMMNLGATLVGAASGALAGGGTQGATTGANVGLIADQNNRALHQSEKDRIHQLAGGDKAKEDRLTAAACVMTNCAAAYPSDSEEGRYYADMQKRGATYTNELTTLQQQRGLNFLDYSVSDMANDFVKQMGRNTLQGFIQGALAGYDYFGLIGSGIAGMAPEAPASDLGKSVVKNGVGPTAAAAGLGALDMVAGAINGNSEDVGKILGGAIGSGFVGEGLNVLSKVGKVGAAADGAAIGANGASEITSGAVNNATALPLKGQLANESLASSGANMDNIKVTAQASVDGQVYVDTNQMARASSAADANTPTLISDRVATNAADKGKPLPNGNMADAHAEIGTIQQAYDAGKTVGKDMTMTVTGEPICGHCVGDIAAAADKSGLKSLTIKAVDELGLPVTYTWFLGMKSIKKVTP